MSWLASLVVAFLTAVLALIATGFLAALLVEWYRISSFEGGSGFFVVFTAIFGGAAGAVIGLIAARVVAARPHPGFVKAVGAAAAAVLVLLAVIGGAARLLADVPPEIDGETLLLHIELRSPAGDTTDPAALPGVPYVRMGALAPFSNVRRVSDDGPLWADDLRREDGRWIVPGAVPIFTARGRKVIDVGVGDRVLMGLLAPLSGSPSRRDMEWSPWYPHAPEGQPPLADQFTLRYRVVKANDSVRTIKAGPFDIDLMISGFYHVVGSDDYAADTTFAVRHDGQAVPALSGLDAVSVVSAASPALIVRSDDRRGGSGDCQLVIARGGKVDVTKLSSCTSPDAASLLTTDPASYRKARARTRVPGWVDRDTFASTGLYLFPEAVFDSRSLSVRPARLTGPNGESPNVNVPPLGISPDERSVAWFTLESEDEAYVGVTDTIGGPHALLPIDRARMRYANFNQLDPAWLLHHFQWVRDDGGVDRLFPREGFVPLPYRGDYTNDDDYAQYKLEPAGTPLRAAIEEWLVSELKAAALPGNTPDAFSHAYRVNGTEISVMASDDSSYVALAMPTGTKDETGVIKSIGERFDQALASGKYDALFGRRKN